MSMAVPPPVFICACFDTGSFMAQVTCVHVAARCTAQNARQRKRLHMPARGDVPVAQPLASVEQAEQRAMGIGRHLAQTGVQVAGTGWPKAVPIAGRVRVCWGRCSAGSLRESRTRAACLRSSCPKPKAKSQKPKAKSQKRCWRQPHPKKWPGPTGTGQTTMQRRRSVSM